MTITTLANGDKFYDLSMDYDVKSDSGTDTVIGVKSPIPLPMTDLNVDPIPYPSNVKPLVSLPPVVGNIAPLLATLNDDPGNPITVATGNTMTDERINVSPSAPLSDVGPTYVVNNIECAPGYHPNADRTACVPNQTVTPAPVPVPIGHTPIPVQVAHDTITDLLHSFGSPLTYAKAHPMAAAAVLIGGLLVFGKKKKGRKVF